MQRDQVMLERLEGVRFDGQTKHRSGDERVAVAIPADPRTHRNHTRIADRFAEAVAHEPFQVALKARHGGEDARPVIPQCLVDLIANAKLRQPQHGGLPQHQDLETQLVVDLGQLAGAGERTSAPVQQLGDRVDAVEHRLASHLGGVGGDHRRHRQVAELGDDPLVRDATSDQLVEAGGDAALLGRRPGIEMVTAAPLLVQILCCVGQQRQPSEGTDHVQLVVDLGRPQDRGECSDWVTTVAPGLDSSQSHAFDEVERSVTGLLSEYVTDHGPHEPDVIAVVGRCCVGHCPPVWSRPWLFVRRMYIRPWLAGRRRCVLCSGWLIQEFLS